MENNKRKNILAAKHNCAVIFREGGFNSLIYFMASSGKNGSLSIAIKNLL